MLFLYTGTPGSGKTLHATERIDICLCRGKNVICNYPIKTDKRHKGDFIYLKTQDFSVDFLVKYALENHKISRQAQTFVVIDEAHILFNSRGYNVRERMKWLEFLACHRHFCYDILLITQSDRAIDLQVRGLIEFNYKHRLNESYGIIGFIIAFFLRLKFTCVKYWYVIDEKCSVERFGLKKRISRMYDTFAMFDCGENFDIEDRVENSDKVEIFNKKRGYFEDNL
jgi:hypothetical protein